MYLAKKEEKGDKEHRWIDRKEREREGLDKSEKSEEKEAGSTSTVGFDERHTPTKYSSFPLFLVSTAGEHPNEAVG